jgi:hypothetical protein
MAPPYHAERPPRSRAAASRRFHNSSSEFRAQYFVSVDVDPHLPVLPTKFGRQSPRTRCAGQHARETDISLRYRSLSRFP